MVRSEATQPPVTEPGSRTPDGCHRLPDIIDHTSCFGLHDETPDHQLDEPNARFVNYQTAQLPLSPFQALRADVPSALLAITLLLMPLYRTRILEDSFNTPKLALAMILAVLTTIGLLARPQSFRMKLRWYPAPWLLVGLAVWQAVSVLWADSKPLGVDGTVYFATFAVLGWLFYRGPRSVAALRGLFNAGAAGAALTAAWVLVDDFSSGTGSMVARLPDWRGYLAAGLGNSGHIAGMVGMFLPWVLISFLRKDGDDKSIAKSFFLLPVIAMMFAAMTVTWSVGSAGATIVSLLTWVVVAYRWARPGLFHWKRLAAVVAVGFLVMGFYFIPNPVNPHKPSLLKQAFGSSRWEAGWPTRIVIWKTTWQMIRQDPMVGIGSGNFTYGYTKQVVPSVINDPVLQPYSGAFTNDAHNDYLQLWAEGGVIALACWVAVLSTFVVTMSRALRRRLDDDTTLALLGAGTGMTVFALDGLMSFPMRLPAHFAAAVFFLSVPGVLLRLQARQDLAAAEPVDLTSAASRKYGKSLRIGGIGILLTLAACVWHHGHRIVAEFYLKAGRSAAETAMLNMDGQFAPAWNVSDQIYQQTLRAVAAGAPEETWRAGLEQMAGMANGAAMDEAAKLFERALDADRWYANASSRLAQLMLFRGRFSECVDLSRRTLKTLHAYEIHERMGAAAFFSGDWKTAREHWMVCLNRRPEMAEFYRALLSRLPR